jgi:tetratricopeptide (TPR) repeat protein
MAATWLRSVRRRGSRVAWAILIVTAGRVLADEPANDVNAQSRKLYERATAAKTFAELNQVLTQADALRSQATSEKQQKYLHELQAWVLHRRGEAYVKQAADAVAAGHVDISHELDQQAMSDFDAAIKLDPQRWKSYHHRGVCYALAGDFEKALADFTKTIELRPEYASAWFNRGETHYELGQFAEAVADYTEAIRLQGNDAGHFTSRGHAYFQLRQFEKALADYHRAVELDPSDPQRVTNRGEAHRSLGHWAEAADDFRQAVNLDNACGRALQCAAWLMATCPDEQYRHPDLALRAAQKAIELDGDQDYIYLDSLAAALANRGQFDKAQGVIKRAILLAPPENAAPLKHRLELYRSGKPFRQTIEAAPRRVAATPQRAPR